MGVISKIKKAWNDTTPEVRTVAAIGTGALILWYFWPDGDDKSGGAAPDEIEVDYSKTTYTADEFSLMADSLEAAFFGAPLQLWELDEAAGNILRLMWNLDDIKALTIAYGIRGATFATSGFTLPASVTRFLDTDEIEETNAVYQDRGINFRWQ